MLFFIITILAVAALLGIAAFTKFEVKNEGYERLKWLVMRWHYIVVFVTLLVKTLNIPYGLETIEVVSGIGALIAGLIGISTVQYKAANTDEMNDMGRGEADE